MNMQSNDIQQRLGFIDQTILHAVRACLTDDRVPEELREYVQMLGQRSDEIQRALRSCDVHGVRQSVDDLTRICHEAQDRIHPTDDMNYELKSAVILTHIELSALRYQLD